MNNNGYDKSQPITLWEIEKEKYILVDGHTRREAAEKVGLVEIPATVLKFSSLEDAQHYVLRRQLERRSLTQGELLNFAIIMLTKRKRDGTGRSVEKLAKELKVSPSTLVHAKTVSVKASEEDLNEIKNGTTTINKVYQKIKNKKSKKVNIENNVSQNQNTKNFSLDTEQGLVNIEEIIILLREHKEETAIKIISDKFKNN